ncbi:MAG: hypothetical protein U0792_11760 [Gemmataceae bacterium]
MEAFNELPWELELRLPLLPKDDQDIQRAAFLAVLAHPEIRYRLSEDGELSLADLRELWDFAATTWAALSGRDRDGYVALEVFVTMVSLVNLALVFVERFPDGFDFAGRGQFPADSEDELNRLRILSALDQFTAVGMSLVDRLASEESHRRDAGDSSADDGERDRSPNNDF